MVWWYCQHPQPTSETYLTQQRARRVHGAVPPVVVPLSTQLCLVVFMARFQGTAWVAFRPMFSRFDKIGQRVTDRRTDGRTDTRRQHTPYWYSSRDKNNLRLICGPLLHV